MSALEKMEQYISRSNISTDEEDLYYMRCSELRELYEMSRTSDGFWDAIALVFNYGIAKGYRAAKAGH